MTTNRREFIERLGSTAALSALPIVALSSTVLAEPATAPRAESWDFSWTKALEGRKHRALFDCTEIEGGHGVWRASIWADQYQEALGASRNDVRTVLVLRHRAVVLALRDDMWEQAGIGGVEKATHPITQQSTDRNPVLLTARDGVPAAIEAYGLPPFMSRGGIVLVCNLALQNFGGRWAARAGIPADDARKRALGALVPGVVLMPSGVLACVKAQEEGCHYVKGS